VFENLLEINHLRLAQLGLTKKKSRALPAATTSWRKKISPTGHSKTVWRRKQ
jgi:hypothetical protein